MNQHTSCPLQGSKFRTYTKNTKTGLSVNKNSPHVLQARATFKTIELIVIPQLFSQLVQCPLQRLSDRDKRGFKSCS